MQQWSIKQFFKKGIVFVLQLEAKLVLRKYKPKIIAVVGSVGKTSTKDVLYSVLSTSFFVRKSEKSFNSEIGIPLTILGCQNAWLNPFMWLKNLLKGLTLIILKNNYPTWLILEVGADRPGDIKAIAEWLKPDIVVITRFPSVPVHVEYFSSPEELVKEKESIISSLTKNGVLVLNGDDVAVRSLAQKYKNVTSKLFGCGKGNYVTASHYRILYKQKAPTGFQFRIHYDGTSIPISVEGVLGKHHIYPLLAGFTIGIMQEINVVTIEKALSCHQAPPGRMRILSGIKGTTIIDDSYNSSPVATEEALATLGEIKTEGKKVAVLGDMLELGQYSVEEHKKIGKKAVDVCELLLTVGPRARHIAQEAISNGMNKNNVFQYDDARNAGKELETKLTEGDVILIKGSQGVRTEHTVEEIMRYPMQKGELLVRQDKAWQRR